LTEALERDPGRIDIYFDLAWLLATCPDERVRDSVLAIRIAQRALELDAVNADFMEVMAAAHADLGDFDEAVRWRALALDAVIHAI
jgi:hypothetical protein